MTNRWVLLCVVAVLPQPQLATSQDKVQEHRTASHKVGCTVHVQDFQWTPTAPAIVSGNVENLTEGPLEISLRPALYLSSKTSSADRDRYWAPVDLFGDGPLPVDNGKGGIRARPIKLTFKTKGESLDFRLDAQRVFWAREISSVWPSQKLFVAVEPGSYDLRLVLGEEDGDSACAIATVVIPGSKPRLPKP